MTDACNCVWLSVGSKITMPAQHPSLVSVAVINKMMKMQLGVKWFISLHLIVHHREH